MFEIHFLRIGAKTLILYAAQTKVLLVVLSTLQYFSRRIYEFVDQKIIGHLTQIK